MNLFYCEPKLGVRSKTCEVFDLDKVLSILNSCLRLPELLGEMNKFSVCVILFSMSLFESLIVSFFGEFAKFKSTYDSTFSYF